MSLEIWWLFWSWCHFFFCQTGSVLTNNRYKKHNHLESISYIWNSNYFWYHGILFLWAFCSVGFRFLRQDLIMCPSSSWTHYIARDGLESSSCLRHPSAGFQVWTTIGRSFPVCLEGNSWSCFLERSVAKFSVGIHVWVCWRLRDTVSLEPAHHHTDGLRGKACLPSL